MEQSQEDVIRALQSLEERIAKLEAWREHAIAVGAPGAVPIDTTAPHLATGTPGTPITR